MLFSREARIWFQKTLDGLSRMQKETCEKKTKELSKMYCDGEKAVRFEKRFARTQSAQEQK